MNGTASDCGRMAFKTTNAFCVVSHVRVSRDFFQTRYNCLLADSVVGDGLRRSHRSRNQEHAL
jgi:hypothetical protein